MRNKVLITTSSFGKLNDEAIEKLENNNLQVIPNPFNRKLTEDEIFNLLQREKPIGLIAGTELITERVLKASAGYLRVISRVGAGWDNVDHKAAELMGIKVYRTPDAATQSVAELTLGLILNLLRKISWMDRQLREGSWNKKTGNLLLGKRIGIIGFGRIGRRLAELLEPFKVEIGYYDLSKIKTLLPAKQMELEAILDWSDIVTLHVSASESNPLVLNEKMLGLMKKGSWLINASRGGIIDEDALYKSLKSGHLAGAALDVFGKEPYTGRLRSLDNAILTPHIGSYAAEAREQMELEAVDNLLKGLG